MNFILLLLILPPILLMTVLVDEKTRLRLIFMAFGLFAAYLSGQINSVFCSLGGLSPFDLSIHVSPVIEEFIKAFPLVLFLFAARPDRRSVLEYAVWTGLGFAFFENAWAFSQSVSWFPTWQDVTFALSRGFGASLVHSFCTLILVYGISVCMKRRKLLVTGSLAVFSLVCMIHSTFNVLIQSRYAAAPFFFTLGTYAALAAIFRKKKKQTKKIE